MKLYKSIFAVLAVAATSGALVSCDDDLDRPPVIVPVATYEANTSIAEFKELFWNAAQNNTPETIPVNADGDSIILAGRVISSDQSGNVYQRIYVRDESGAMDFRIYGYDLNESYHMGQEVRINVTGLLVGGYGTQMQIGVWYTNPNTGSTSLGGMDKDEFIRRAQRQGLPAATDAEPYTVKISDLEAWKNDKEKLIQWQCQLVKIENVSFDGGGQEAWCNNPGQTGSTNRTLKDAEGNSITVRTSDKSKFASQILPKGTGSVVAILGYYNGTWQLTVMDPQSGCIDGFEFVDAPSGPSGDAIFSETFATGLGKFKAVNDLLPEGVSEIWKYDSHKYAIATAYINKANYASDSWLVSPEIDLSAQSAAFLSFDQALNFFASIETAKTETSVCIREAGTTAWTVLSVPAYPASMSWNFANSGDIDLAAFIGKKVEIGFHYTSTASKAGTWQIRNVLIETTANHPVTPDTPVNPPVAGDAIYSGLSENATSIDWTFEDNSAENVNEIWAWKSYNGLYYLNASAFVGNVAYPATAYACSPVIDLTAVTSAKMTFDQTAKFQTTLRTLCSVVVREEGASDWTELTVPAWPAAGSWDFVSAGEIDLSAYAGKKIQVGFKYGSSAEGADTWRVKNLKITE